jgi:AraC family transcriptional regulator
MRAIGGAACELRTIETGPDARSVLVHPDHVILASVAGGGRDVRVSVDGAPAYRGPKLAGAAGFFPRHRRVESIWPASRLRYLLVTIPHAALEGLADSPLRDDHWRAAPSLDDQLMQAAMAEIGEVLARPANPTDDLLAEALVSTLQLKLIQRCSRYADPERGGVAPLRRALDLVEDHLGERITIADLCAASGIPRARLARAFREQTGMPPHRYIVTRRLERACVMLTTTDLLVSEIAARVGFASGSHLTALLQQHMSLCPRAIRQGGRRI